MSLNVDSFKKHYHFEPGKKGINFEPLNNGSFIPRPYFTELGAAILITMTNTKVEIVPNGLKGPYRLLGEMIDSTTAKLVYRTRVSEGTKPFTDFYAGRFVSGILGFLQDNGNDVRHVFEEYNPGSSNYVRYVGAMLNNEDPVSALSFTWGGEMMRKNNFKKAALLTPENSWMNGEKIKAIYSK